MALLVTCLIVLVGISPAAAAEPVDDSGYSEQQRAKAEKAAAAETAERTCDLVATGPTAGLKNACIDFMESKFTREAMPAMLATTLCTAATATNPGLGAACLVGVRWKMEEIKDWFWTAYEQALGVAETVAFIANPEVAFEKFVNTVKEGAVSLFESVMTTVTSTSAFDPGASWWRASYAATAGIGLVLLTIGLLVMFKQVGIGALGPEEASRALTFHVPLAAVMLFFGPPVAWAFTWLADGMSAGIIHWMGPDGADFLLKGAAFATMTAKIPGGLVMGLILFGALFIAALGLLGTFLVQTLATYIFGAMAGAAWGMTVHPAWRSKALAVPLIALALLLAKPATLLVLAIVVKMSNAMATTETDNVVQLLGNAWLIVLALLMVTLTPWALLKYAPLLPERADSVRTARSTGVSSAVGTAGSTASMAAMNRARGSSGAASSPRTDTSSAGMKAGGARGGTTGSAARPGQAPAAAGASGNSKNASALSRAGSQQSGPRAANVGAMGKSASSGAGRAATGAGASAAAPAAGGAAPGAVAAGAGRTAAAGAASGAGKTAAVAGGSAATGGALLAAHLAAQSASAAVQRARDVADSAAPTEKG